MRYVQYCAILPTLILCASALAGPQDDLFTAAAQCDVAGIQKALDAGADVNALNSSNQNALASAFFCPDATRLLLDKGCDPNGGEYPAVIQAANNYSVDVLKMLLEAGADPNKVGIVDPGLSINKLIETEKAKGKAANKTMIGAWEGMLKNMQKTEVNALIQTVQQTNCAPCLELLIKHGGDVNKAEKDGNLLHRLAIFSMTPEKRKEAFAAGAPNMAAWGLKVPDWYGNLPDAYNRPATEMLDLLVKAGSDLNQKNAMGSSPLLLALQQHRLELSKGMIRHGADAVSVQEVMYGKIKVPYHPICAAAEFADLELMQMIIGKGADINVDVQTRALGITVVMDTDYGGNVTWGGDGYTPLIIAIMSGHIDVANLLLDSGASIRKGSSGTAILKTKFHLLNCLTIIKNKTPIYWAVEQDDMALVERIGKAMEWKFNPDFTIKQLETGGFAGWKCKKFKAKQSPSSYAAEVGNDAAASLLQAKGL